MLLVLRAHFCAEQAQVGRGAAGAVGVRGLGRAGRPVVGEDLGRVEMGGLGSCLGGLAGALPGSSDGSSLLPSRI